MNLQRHSAMPEFLTPRPGIDAGSWEVESGLAMRGNPWTNIDQRRMKVPFGGDKFSQVIRAHELMHAQVSPIDPAEAIKAIKCSRGAGIAAEEFRVNTLCSRAGFNMDDLIEGSEKKSGERCAENDDWESAVLFLGSLAGTKAAKDFIAGVRKVNKDWASSLTRVNTALINEAKKVNLFHLSNVKPDPDHGNIPYGFRIHTAKFAKILDAAIQAEDEDAKEPILDSVKNSIATAIGKSGTFAMLHLDENVPLTNHVRGTMGRKRIATNIGRNPRRLHRALTDPEMRIFDRTTKGQGGIIIIDQSGSMSLTTNDVWSIVNTAPGCVIIGYSHRTSTQPNTWVLAERGKVCEQVREGGHGNGVDGPALRFALSKRKMNEPVIWVCDGMVTDGESDSWYDALGEECVRLVIKHGIHTVTNVPSALEALEEVKRGKKPAAQVTGYLRDTPSWRNYTREVAA